MASAGRGKRLTLRASLLPYIQEVMQCFGLEDESSAVNLIIGSCSSKPIAWLAMRPGDAPPLPPAAIEVPALEVRQQELSSPVETERNVLDLLADDIESMAA
jgi:hypothetical protein